MTTNRLHELNGTRLCFTVNGSSRMFIPDFHFRSAKTCEARQARTFHGLQAINSSYDSVAYPTGKRKSETRVFLNTGFTTGDEIPLPHEELKHLRALRFKNGDEFVVFNGAGKSATAALQNRSAVVLEARDNLSSSKAQLSALVAIPKNASRSDCIVEKLTELGANSITFMRTNRTVATVPSANKLERWKRIAIAASKQSLRDAPPEISAVDFSSAVEIVLLHPLPFILCSVGDLLLSNTYGTRIQREKQALVIVGPEGGFETGEAKQLKDAGAIPVSLGSNRLRIETAAIVSVALISQILYMTMVKEHEADDKSKSHS